MRLWRLTDGFGALGSLRSPQVYRVEPCLNVPDRTDLTVLLRDTECSRNCACVSIEEITDLNESWILAEDWPPAAELKDGES